MTSVFKRVLQGSNFTFDASHVRECHGFEEQFQPTVGDLAASFIDHCRCA